MLFNWSFVLRDVQKASNLMSEEIRPRYIVTRVRLLNATEIKKNILLNLSIDFFFQFFVVPSHRKIIKLVLCQTATYLVHYSSIVTRPSKNESKTR